MLIGVPKEIKVAENRVGMVPAGVQTLVDQGHDVMIETTAGVGAGIPDSAYEAVGARIVANADQLVLATSFIVSLNFETLPVVNSRERFVRRLGVRRKMLFFGTKKL